MPTITKTAYRYVESPISIAGTDPVRALERLICEPAEAQNLSDITSRFAATLRVLQETKGVQALCFLLLDKRPIGTLFMIPKLTEELKIPACVWSKSEQKIVIGQSPRRHDKVALVYDVCLTGSGLLQAAKHLTVELRAEVVGAVVFFNATRKSILVDKKVNFPILSLAISHETLSVAYASKLQEGGERSPATPAPATPLAPDKEGIEMPKEVSMLRSIQSSTTSRVFLSLLGRSVPLFGATACVAFLFLKDVTFPVAVILLLGQGVLSLLGIAFLFKLTKP
jgi:hypothetical protein